MGQYHQIYFSPTGSSKKIVETITGVISDAFQSHDLTLKAQRKLSINLGPDDLLVVGLPVYSGHIPQLVEERLGQCRGSNTPVILLAIYGNRDYFYALDEMHHIFNQRGFISLSLASFIGQHSYTSQVATGRPDQEDLAFARAYGQRLKKRLERPGGFDLDHVTYQAHGDIPDRSQSLPLAPVVADSCLGCGLCQEACPTSIILTYKPHSFREVDCIRCHACVRVCPHGAIYFDERLAHVSQWLIKECGSIRKEPQIKYMMA